MEAGADTFPGIVRDYGVIFEVGTRLLPMPEGVPGPVGPPGLPGSDGSDGADAYGYGGMFVEYDDGTCFTANPLTADCGCPDSYIPLVMLISGSTGYDGRERLLYLCY
jgi:hypothetical protein